MVLLNQKTDVELVGHLMRRAAFGEPIDRLEEKASSAYEVLVDDLINVDKFPRLNEDLLERHNIQHADEESRQWTRARWIYRMINSERPLEEKVALMWHDVFATGDSKVGNNPMMRTHYEMLRDYGLGNFRNLLLALAKDPAMIYWLDQQMNHAEAPNENFGRELLELFSMGIGNYTEEDVKECARAFTGWTKSQTIPRYPNGFFDSEFIFREEDHDNGPKTFLGETGNFNGDDIIDIIVKQPATAQFVAAQIYDFFVSDDPDAARIDDIARVFIESEYVISDVLRFVFNSDFFKESRFNKVKSPAELVVGTAILAGRHQTPYEFGLTKMATATKNMGQDLLNPPTVEGWHTGREWIDSSYLVERINFSSKMIGDIKAPGTSKMLARISTNKVSMTPDELLDACLSEMGKIHLKPPSRAILFEELNVTSDLTCGTEEFESVVSQVLRLIVSSREYQFS